MRLSSNKIACFLSLLGSACGAGDSLRRGLRNPAFCSVSKEVPVTDSCGPEGSVCLQSNEWASQYGTGREKSGEQIQGSPTLGWWDAGDWATYGPIDFGADPPSAWIDEITFRFTSNGIDKKEHGDQYVEILVSTTQPGCPDEDWDTFGTHVATIEPELFARGQMSLQTVAIGDILAFTGEVYITLLCRKKDGAFAWGFWNLDYFYIRPLSDVGGSCGADDHCSTGICDEVAEKCLSGLGGACETDANCAEGICHSDKCVSNRLYPGVVCDELKGSEYVIEVNTSQEQDIDFGALQCFTNNFRLRVKHGVTLNCNDHYIIAKAGQSRPAFYLEGSATMKNCRINGFSWAIMPSDDTDPAVPVTINILDSYFEGIEDIISQYIAWNSDTTVNLVGNHFRDVNQIFEAYYRSAAASLTISVVDSVFDKNPLYGHGYTGIELSDENSRDVLDSCPTHRLVFENNTVVDGAPKPRFEIEAGNCEFMVEFREGHDHEVNYVLSDLTGSVTVLGLSDLGGPCQGDNHCLTRICEKDTETCVSSYGGFCESDMHCGEGICHSGKCVPNYLYPGVVCEELQDSEYVIEVDTLQKQDIDFGTLECFTNDFRLRVKHGVTLNCNDHNIIAKAGQSRPAFYLEGSATLKNCHINGFSRAIMPSDDTDPAVSVTINILDSYFEGIEDIISQHIAWNSDTTVNLVGNHFRDVHQIFEAYYRSAAASLTIFIVDSVFHKNPLYGNGDTGIELSDENARDVLNSCPTHSLVFENNTVVDWVPKPRLEIEAGNCEFEVELRDGHEVNYVDSDLKGSVTVLGLSDFGEPCQVDNHCLSTYCDKDTETCVSSHGGFCESDMHCGAGICHSDKCVPNLLYPAVVCDELQGSEYVIEVDTSQKWDIDFGALECFTDDFRVRIKHGVTLNCYDHNITAKAGQSRPAFYLEGSATLKNCHINGFSRAIMPSEDTDPAVPVTINILDSYFEGIEDIISQYIAWNSDTTVNLVGNHFRDVHKIFEAYYRSAAASLTISIVDSVFDENTLYDYAVIELWDENRNLDSCPTHSLVFANNTVALGANSPRFEIEAGDCEFVVELRDGHEVDYVLSDQTGSVTVLEQIN